MKQILLNKQLENNQKNKIAKENIVYNTLPPDICTTLDNIAYQLAIKENKNISKTKQNMVLNLDKLTLGEINYLVSNLNELIYKTTHNNEEINDKNVDKSFITFLIRLYY